VKLLIGCEKGKTLVLDLHYHFLTENEIKNARLFDASIFNAYFSQKMGNEVTTQNHASDMTSLASDFTVGSC